MLSALDVTVGSVLETLDNYIMQCKAIKNAELEICVEQLRRYRRFQYALDIIEWMETRKIDLSWSNYVVQLDLVSKTKGAVAAVNFFSGLPFPAKNKQVYVWCSVELLLQGTSERQAIELFLQNG
ncbi:hypothetical protein V8G54_029964 [Vigna mungo]|uniref:Pentatricopeptide repeat-containing protein n=1 Tax=Vigna mungo TaxID=3915 RepID=A0AAQ3RMC8_VIGMU